MGTVVDEVPQEARGQRTVAPTSQTFLVHVMENPREDSEQEMA